MMGDLAPPKVTIEDPGAHELDVTHDEHFVDTSGGQEKIHTPIPITRVEKVDDKPSHGDVPGTAAHSVRTQDAVPDEIEIIPEGSRSRSASILGSRTPSRNASQDGARIPKTIVEKIDPQTPSSGEVPGTLAYALHKADAEPDVIVMAPETNRMDLEGSPTSTRNRSPVHELQPPKSIGVDLREMVDRARSLARCLDEASAKELVKSDDEGFGDDFNDFEEGDGEHDFEAFDNGGLPAMAPLPSPSAKTYMMPHEQMSPNPPPLFSFEGLETSDDIIAACQPYVNRLFPSVKRDNALPEQSLAEVDPSFLTERSQSLWAQLVAPPPLQPPDWVRSRIRRLFLVSLGVPVDLDEILPASKQKKLVLPSFDVDTERSPSRRSTDFRPNGSIARLRHENGSSASINSSASKSERRRRGPPQHPELDINSTRLLCSVTQTALANLTDMELRSHVSSLEWLKQRASEVLEHWLVQKDSAIGDKEAFEEVIENLVKHAKKIRK